MAELGFCSFNEFWGSGFMYEYISQDKDGNNSLATPGAKIIFGTVEDDLYGQDGLHTFYKKGSQRWVKKLEVSDQQLLDDCQVVLLGDNKYNKPESILFEFSHDSFEFPLTNHMIEEIEFAKENGDRDFFPGYTDSSRVRESNEALPYIGSFNAPGNYGYGFSFKNPEKSKTYKAVIRLLKNGPMKKGDILNALNDCGALPHRDIDWNKDPGKRGQCSSMFIAMHRAKLIKYDRNTHEWSLGPLADYYIDRYNI